jgi:hypothetical protein
MKQTLKQQFSKSGKINDDRFYRDEAMPCAAKATLTCATPDTHLPINLAFLNFSSGLTLERSTKKQK